MIIFRLAYVACSDNCCICAFALVQVLQVQFNMRAAAHVAALSTCQQRNAASPG